MATPDKQQAPVSQAKITQRLAVRTAVLALGLAGLFAGFRYYQSLGGDFDQFGAGDTAGLLAAIEDTDDGSRAVLIKPDGTVVPTASWKTGVVDRDLVWRPDGKFLFFVSDRKAQTFHVYRWNPDLADAEERTTGTRSRSNPTFAVDDKDDVEPLVTSGGVVQLLDPEKRATPQILPPLAGEITQTGTAEDGGTEGAFAAVYGQLGSSIRIAQWCKGKAYVAAVMRRDPGEVLVLQSMTPKDGRLPRPEPLAAGDRIEFSVSPKDGSIVYAVQNFRFPPMVPIPAQFIKNKKIVVPFKHVVFTRDPAAPPTPPVVASDRDAFASPAISPDGATLLVTVGRYDDSAGMTPGLLLTMPARPGAGPAAAPLVRGEVYEPAWSPDGERVVFARRANGKRDLVSIDKNGSGERNLTGGKGNFRTPRFSPQLPK